MTDNIGIRTISQEPEPPRKSRSVMWKIGLIAVLILLMLIPLAMINGVIEERQVRKNEVVEEFARTWAGRQTVLGPLLVVPYRNVVEQKDEKGKVNRQVYERLAYLLPEEYAIRSLIRPEIRYRGIFQSTVYTADITATGNFNVAALKQLDIPEKDILWHKAFLYVSIPQQNGLVRPIDLQWKDKPLELTPGSNGVLLPGPGLYTLASAGNNQTIPFRMALTLKGSQALSIAPIGKQNTLKVASSWTSPSFIGNTLPSTRKVDKEGFRATWEIPYFARNYGQAFTDNMLPTIDLLSPSVGVELLTPVDFYRQVERAVKYGSLFLVLTFATYFLYEVIGRHRLHAFQYLLVGCALTLFYLMLLALSEVMDFVWAYTLASGATIASISLYSRAILGRARRNAEWLIAALLTVLYGYLYVLLQLEDLSLLFGTLGLFLVLSIIMYVTRNIDWYSEQATT